MIVLPNQVSMTLRSADTVHITLTAKRSCPSLRLQSCSLSKLGSMSNRLSVKYTVVPLAIPSASKDDPCTCRLSSEMIVEHFDLKLLHSFAIFQGRLKVSSQLGNIAADIIGRLFIENKRLTSRNIYMTLLLIASTLVTHCTAQLMFDSKSSSSTQILSHSRIFLFLCLNICTWNEWSLVFCSAYLQSMI